MRRSGYRTQSFFHDAAYFGASILAHSRIIIISAVSAFPGFIFLRIFFVLGQEHLSNVFPIDLLTMTGNIYRVYSYCFPHNLLRLHRTQA